MKDALTSEPVYNQDLNKLSWNGNAWVSEKLAFWEKNLKVTKFNYAFSNCVVMKVNKDIFIGDGITKENRFASATATINLSGIFNYAGYDLPAGDGNWGTCPDLWNYTFNENGYGWTSKPMVFNQYSTSNWTNGDEMLANQWHKDTPVDLANWKKP